MIISYSKGFVFVHPAKCAGESVEYHLGPRLPLYDIIIGPQPHRPRGWNRLTRAVTRLEKHSGAREIRDFLGPRRFGRYLGFTIVRHPEHRVVSYYRYLVDLLLGHPDFRRLAARGGAAAEAPWEIQRAAFLNALGMTAGALEDALATGGRGALPIFARPPLTWQAMRALVTSPGFADFVPRLAASTDGRFRAQADLICDADGTVLVDEIIRFETLAEDWRRVGGRIGFEGDLPRRNVSKTDVAVDLTDAARQTIRTAFAADYELFRYR